MLGRGFLVEALVVPYQFKHAFTLLRRRSSPAAAPLRRACSANAARLLRRRRSSTTYCPAAAAAAGAKTSAAGAAANERLLYGVISNANASPPFPKVLAGTCGRIGRENYRVST